MSTLTRAALHSACPRLPLSAPPRGVRCSRRLRCAARVAARASALSPSAPLAAFEAFVLDAQAQLCADVAALDGGASFGLDAWERSGDAGGYGRTRVLEGGALLEKAAANVSVVRGVLSASRAAAMSARGRPGVDPRGGQAYSAVALSLVFHAASPLVPTLRADVRAFAVEGAAWFGGGADLTPAYLFPDDAAHFHATLAQLCDRHQPAAAPRRALYAACKRACDAYFYLVRASRFPLRAPPVCGCAGLRLCSRGARVAAQPARGERRGLGGLFFDDVPSEPAASALFDAAPVADAAAFARDLAAAWLPAWAPLTERRRRLPYSDAQRTWQLQRRGRYLEFNLLYDRGVKFGLDGGRIEAIMVSAPPLIRWDYNVVPAPGSPEAALLAELTGEPRDWADMA